MPISNYAQPGFSDILIALFYLGEENGDACVPIQGYHLSLYIFTYY
jgi:hypothetical protein